MPTPAIYSTEFGPFRAEQIHNGDQYELSNGHAIYCMSTGGRGSKTTTFGVQVLETDPDVESAGVDTGFSPVPAMLRAPDIAVGNIPDAPGWVKGVPPLAVEYADTGQDEESLKKKIQEFFTHGTKYIWVVRLTGPRRVEVYEPNKKMRLAKPGEFLTAPGVLRNPVKVEALYDREAAHEATLRNLLQRQGYNNLEEVKAEGIAEGEIYVLKKLIVHRFGAMPDWAKTRIEQANNEQIEAWAEFIFDAKSIEHLLSIKPE